MDRAGAAFSNGQKGSDDYSPIPEKGRMGLRVKLSDKLQYEVEEYRAASSCASGDSVTQGDPRQQ
jgi:hypothetical protein